MAENPPFITLIAGNDGRWTFNSPEEISAWLEEERQAWAWIRERAEASKGQIRNAWARYQNFFTRVEGALAQFQSDRSKDNLELNLLNLFRSTVGGKNIAIRGTVHAAIIQRVLESHGGPSVEAAVTRAVAALTHISNAEDNVTPSIEYLRRATLSIFDYAHAAADQATAEVATRQAIQLANAELQKRQAALEATAARFESSIASWETRVADLVSGTNSAASEIVASLESVKHTFETQMGLQAPAQYWASKSETHSQNATRYRKRLVGWGTLFVLTTILAYALVLYLVVDQKIGQDNQLATAVLFFGALAVWTTGALWAARIMSRLYLSEHHLGIDAAERATMATTYLALTNERAADEKDRAVVLAALFRPTADGIVKDEPPPMLTPAAFLAGLMSPQR